MIKFLSIAGVFLIANLTACYNHPKVDTDTVAIDQTLEYLLASEGSPTTIKKIPGEYDFIESYYYRASHTTYIVNTETGHICNVSVGKHVGNCPPDDE